MRPLDPIRARYGSISDTTLHTIRTFSSAGAKCLDVMPYFFEVYEAAEALCKALAQDRLAYEKQGELEKLLANVPDIERHRKLNKLIEEVP